MRIEVQKARRSMNAWLLDDRLRGPRLVPLFLRIGLGILILIDGWSKISNLHRVISLSERLHLTAPAVLGPALEMAKVCGGFLLVVGLLTRFLGLFFALALVGEIVATKTPLKNFGGWALEWQSIWMALALLVLGAGPVSLDGFIRGRVKRPLGPSYFPSDEAYTRDLVNRRASRLVARRR
jgi:uncharacterized membrane protein YphA (DoxX/SURF4 family)